MDNLLIAERYSQALIEATASLNVSVDIIYEKLNSLSEMWKSDKEFQNFLLHPEIKVSEKKKLMETVAKELAFPEILLNTVFVLLDKYRFNLICDITTLFNAKANDLQQKATAYISSATPLSETDKVQLKDKLCTIFNKKDIKMETKTDPSLLGGIIINVDRLRIDATIKNTLNEIKNKITQ